MDITEIRVKLVDRSRERLLAFCTLTLESRFVVRDIKIISGPKGPFVAMPSRKVMDRCTRCSGKNHLRAQYCNECGGELDNSRAPRDARGRPRLHVDVAHPINQQCRDELGAAILKAYGEESERAGQPGYVATMLGDDNDELFFDHETFLSSSDGSRKHRSGDNQAGGGRLQAE